ncbi:4-coumarate-ligase [Diplodia corticola]|uniref:4-coumarate-ligase n=1 Tax=Diplodia corticola TaxID=236234 RepID=A0A1J9RCG9_9PEZI|nr:4-coumarate-ligase [Diplodia corticola]OJD30179.1 4-coumarate-ligase [Diplodia corticola]
MASQPKGMYTVVEKTPEGIIYRCPATYSIPNLDILTLLFESHHSSAKEETPLHVSAANPNHLVTKFQARILTKQTGYALRNHFGIGASGPDRDVVTCISTGHHLLPVAFYGVVCAGGVFSAASPSATPADLARQLRQGDSNLLICNEDTKPVAIAAAKDVRLPLDRVLVIPNGGEYALNRASDGTNIVGQKSLEWQVITDKKTLEESLIILIYSSGTTGLPKAVKLSHANVTSEACTALDPWKAYNQENNPTFEYRTLAHLPTAHIAGIQGYLINPFYMGGTVYWMPKFDFPNFLAYNKQHAITAFFTVPPIWLAIAKHPAVTDQFATLQHAVSGAAPLGKDLQLAASKKLGKGGATTIVQTWGLSETTGSITLLPHGETDTTGSVACLIANHSARLVDDAGRDVDPGQPGEVLVRGPVVTNGYHRDDAANAEAFLPASTAAGGGAGGGAEGGAAGRRWFRTGDVAVFRDGKFYIVDRKKELIKYKGLQVAPAELEAVLLAHPRILDAAVIGVPADAVDEGAGTEVPRAYVVVAQPEDGQASSSLSGKQVEEYVARNVADYKRLRGGVAFVAAVPKSPSGKILRKDLRELARREALEAKAKL